MILPQLSDHMARINSLKDHFLVLFNLKPKQEIELIGLDISRDFIKLLRINRSETPHKIENFSFMPAPVPIGGASKDPAKDNAAVADVIREMLRQSGTHIKQVALAIPRSIAILKNITIDKRLTDDEIEARAWIEANRHFPDLIGEIYLDFFIAGASADDESRLEMTLVACRKSQIQPYLDILKLAGLQAKLVDVDCYAFERALPYTMAAPIDDDAIALLSLNSDMSTLIVTKENKLLYAHNQGYDGQRLLAQTNAYTNDKEKNPPVDINNLASDAGYQEILKNNLISHLRHTMHFFSTSRPNININKIILTGDCAMVPCLVPFINRELGIETMLADLLTHLTLSPQINAEEFKKYSHGFTLCCGLALSRLEY